MQPVSSDDSSSLSSKQMHESVLKALKYKDKRNQNLTNGKLSDKEIQMYCHLSSELQELMRQASEQFGLSFRSVNKALKVSRTIADLEESENIQKEHLLEALSYRRRPA